MARGIATTRTRRCILTLCGAAIGALIAFTPALAQNGPPAAPAVTAPAVSKSCQTGTVATADETPLPNVAAALARRKVLRILAMGAAPGRVNASVGGYTALIETMLERTLKGVDVIMINRGVSGELAANAATRMRNEVALESPDLVLWQVGTNDALAYVPTDEFVATLKNQISWLRAHHVDVVLVGLQFANEMLRDAHYVEIRESLRKLAAQENVIVIRFYEAMQIINSAAEPGQPADGDFEHIDTDYNCLAQYVARAITLGVFAIPRR